MIVSQADGQAKPGYYKAFTDPQYRTGNIICVIFSIAVQASGINCINTYLTPVF